MADKAVGLLVKATLPRMVRVGEARALVGDDGAYEPTDRPEHAPERIRIQGLDPFTSTPQL